jgi:2'-5' RNA ligase
MSFKQTICVAISFLSISLAGCALHAFDVEVGGQKKVVTLSRKVIASQNLPFFERESALAMNIPYLPIFKLRKELETSLGAKLRFLTTWTPGGEAHITVITPPEYQKVLSPLLPMKDINALARKMKIQSSEFSVLGLGSGQKVLEGKPESTYFVVVKSEDLLNLRRAVEKEFLRRGGQKGAFSASSFYPHITVGYTLRDLHEADGVIKDLNSLDESGFKLRVQ